jgi:CRISPR-associated exonuclease Cas4
MLYIAFGFLLVAFLLFIQARRQRHAAGLPFGRIIFADTRTWGAVEQPIYDPQLGLVGKPDYLVEVSGGDLIPVEVKSSRIGSVPYDAHILQLAAYCLLVQSQFGKRPPYGILHYPNHTFEIDFTPELERTVRDTIQEMHTCDKKRDLPRSHGSAARCRRCGYRNSCDQRLL